ncbi:hypothetical protein K469DRAFT_142270 [Zopfia rhizophila CBS 207.26]|uniref:Uncharacterized protein n=1 Tax=Zopfia rhizophila CBS 207.26 TaxID=1314779 RepID=A0A6A6E807_9PEZI|nr:hypothetical protein K469DRAFT_142270 [Zopfia rhizophila CBS 207.26]
MPSDGFRALHDTAQTLAARAPSPLPIPPLLFRSPPLLSLVASDPPTLQSSTPSPVPPCKPDSKSFFFTSALLPRASGELEISPSLHQTKSFTSPMKAPAGSGANTMQPS